MAQKDLFLAELVFTLASQVQEDISSSPINPVDSLPDECFISQCITGDYSAYTALYGDDDVLTAFASAYSKFEVDDDIKNEILADFLNLNNGRFAVSLSDTLALECSLTVPIFTPPGERQLLENTYVIPITFSFGTVNFVLSENHE